MGLGGEAEAEAEAYGELVVRDAMLGIERLVVRAGLRLRGESREEDAGVSVMWLERVARGWREAGERYAIELLGERAIMVSTEQPVMSDSSRSELEELRSGTAALGREVAYSTGAFTVPPRIRIVCRSGLECLVGEEKEEEEEEEARVEPASSAGVEAEGEDEEAGSVGEGEETVDGDAGSVAVIALSFCVALMACASRLVRWRCESSRLSSMKRRTRRR